MRCLGEVQNRKSAELFVAYLLTQGISTHVDIASEDQDRWEIWVRDEDRLGERGNCCWSSRPIHRLPSTSGRARGGRLLAEKAKDRCGDQEFRAA